MSRTAIREAINTYLTNAGLPVLASVKSFPAKFTPEMEFYQGEDPGTQDGVLIYLYVESQRERRIALGGAHSGEKLVDYTFILNCFFRSTKRKTEDVGADNETFLDALVAAIRADRQAGAPGVIFEWGEGAGFGGPDIEITSYYPRTLNGAGSATQVFSTVRVSVSEILQA